MQRIDKENYYLDIAQAVLGTVHLSAQMLRRYHRTQRRGDRVRL